MFLWPQPLNGIADQGSKFPGPFPESEFLDLSSRGFRQVAENNGLRRLEACKMLPAECDQVGLVNVGAAPELDKGAGRFPPFFVRACHDRGGPDIRMFV